MTDKESQLNDLKLLFMRLWECWSTVHIEGGSILDIPEIERKAIETVCENTYHRFCEGKD